MRIKYKEVNGRIEVCYRLDPHEWKRFPHALDTEEDSVWMNEMSIGPVPRAVRRSGEKAIAEWANKKCLEHHERMCDEVRARYIAQETRMLSASYPVEVEHSSGLILRGHAIYTSLFRGRVALDKPFAMVNDKVLYIPNRYAYGIPMFKWSGKLSDRGLALAKEQLRELYDREIRERKHGRALKLVEKLNRQRAKL